MIEARVRFEADARNSEAAKISDPLHDPHVDPNAIAAIVAMPDVVARNYAITRGYHALSEAVAALLGRTDANWLTFGQWASAEAGRAIRGESIPEFARPMFGREIEAAVAGGNGAVFGDVGPPFARFVMAFRDDLPGPRDPADVAATLAELCRHPELTASPDLTRAFHAYADTLLLAEAGDAEPADTVTRGRRAQRLFAANVFIGAAEQRVADPFVRAAIPGRSLLAIVATAHLGIHLPDVALALDRDVPAPAYLGGPPFPLPLMVLDDPDAIALAAEFRQDPTSAARSHAPDWEVYRERMGFIFTFIRAYQRDPALFQMPET